MEKAFSVLSEDEPDVDLATLAAQLGRLHYFRGDHDAAMQRVETALDIGEALGHPETIAQALITMGAIVGGSRPQQETALTSHALHYALEHDLAAAALRAYNNHAEGIYRDGQLEEAIASYQDGIALADRVGNRFWKDLLLSEVTTPLFLCGRWSEALDAVASLSTPDRAMPDVLGRLCTVPTILISMNEAERAEREFSIYARYETSSSYQERASWLAARAAMSNARGSHDEAMHAALEALSTARIGNPDSVMATVGLREGIDAAWALGDAGRLHTVLEAGEFHRSAHTAPLLSGLLGLGRTRLRVLAESEPDETDRGFATAASTFRGCGATFWLATSLVEWADWIEQAGRFGDVGAMKAEARATFESAGATVWLARLDEGTFGPR
jgi:tetratricopeptide (TPR) repeat protein